MRHGLKDGERRLLHGEGDVSDLGHRRRAQDQRRERAAAEADVDWLHRPGRHLGVGCHHEQDCRASLPGARGPDVHEPREFLVRVILALNFEDDRENVRPARTATLATLVKELAKLFGAQQAKCA